jgi:predicted phosphodiesterase
MKRMKIQFASDFHLELYKQLPPFETFLHPSASYLALAGDIGHPTQLRPFFDWVSPQWKYIFYVAGNHEYYNLSSTEPKITLEERKKEIVDLCQLYPNIHFLHSESPSFFLEEEQLAIVGSTLWSDPSPLENWNRMNDYHCIYTKSGLLTTADVHDIHIHEKKVLENEIEYWASKHVPVCMVTHHMPSFDLIEAKYRNCNMNSFFASACDNLFRYPICTWIYGHSHAASKRTHCHIPCVINARGYQREHVGGFRTHAIHEVPFWNEIQGQIDSGTQRKEELEEEVVWA